MISCREMYEKTVLTFSIAFSDETSIFHEAATHPEHLHVRLKSSICIYYMQSILLTGPFIRGMQDE